MPISTDKKILARIAETIRTCRTFFIAGHLKPDGDTIGSGLALASLLRRLGKKPKLYTGETIPDYLCFLPGVKAFTRSERVQGMFDCAIILECASLARMGNLITPDQAKVIVNIDHHATFNHFGNINYIDSRASSSAEQIFRLFRHMDMPLTASEAQCLYTGLVTDTGKFQHSNTTPAALHMAAALIEAGVKPFRLNEKIYATKSLPSLRLLAAALSTLKVTDDGRIARVEVTRDMYRRTRSSVMDTEDIINYTMMLPSTVVGLFFRETEAPGQVKVSLRSRSAFDVNEIARRFGGGGHRNAAGCTVAGTLQSAERKVLGHLRNVLDRDE